MEAIALREEAIASRLEAIALMIFFCFASPERPFRIRSRPETQAIKRRVGGEQICPDNGHVEEVNGAPGNCF